MNRKVLHKSVSQLARRLWLAPGEKGNVDDTLYRSWFSLNPVWGRGTPSNSFGQIPLEVKGRTIQDRSVGLVRRDSEFFSDHWHCRQCAIEVTCKSACQQFLSLVRRRWALATVALQRVERHCYRHLDYERDNLESRLPEVRWDPVRPISLEIEKMCRLPGSPCE